jgi:hypothetical protein
VACLLSTAVLGGHDFNAVFAWFTLFVLIFQHISAYVNGGKSQLLMISLYVLMTIWLFGFIIAYYAINPDSINNL